MISKTKETTMNKTSMNMLAGLMAGAGLLLSAGAQAQDAFPTKPIRIVLGFPAGGPLDQHARLLTDKRKRARSAAGGGLQARSGRLRGGAGRDALARRRLHADAGQYRRDGHQPCALQQAALQYAQGFHADCPHRHAAAGAAGQ
jgi:hypothetical protein